MGKLKLKTRNRTRNAENDDLRNDPRYRNMTKEAAAFIIGKFQREFKAGDFFDPAGLPEWAMTARHLYAIALAWIVVEDQWHGILTPMEATLMKMELGIGAYPVA